MHFLFMLLLTEHLWRHFVQEFLKLNCSVNFSSSLFRAIINLILQLLVQTHFGISHLIKIYHAGAQLFFYLLFFDSVLLQDFLHITLLCYSMRFSFIPFGFIIYVGTVQEQFTVFKSGPVCSIGSSLHICCLHSFFIFISLYHKPIIERYWWIILLLP